jgi:hypothetical protein
MKYFVITGNPIRGFRYIGPFDSATTAAEYKAGCPDRDWWVAELLAPAKNDPPTEFNRASHSS